MDQTKPSQLEISLRGFLQELPMAFLLMIAGALIGFALGNDSVKGICAGAGFGLLFAYVRIAFLPPVRTASNSKGSGTDISMQAWIALFFMVAFFFAVGAAYLNADPAKTKDPELNKQFLEVFKNGVTLVGATVTTVVGYYFGNRTAATAERVAQAALDSRTGSTPQDPGAFETGATPGGSEVLEFIPPTPNPPVPDGI